MIRVGLKSLLARPLRTALISMAIVLGVAMVAAAFTVSDTMRKGADSLSSAAYDGTDAVVAGRTSFKTSNSNQWVVDKPKVSASVLDQVRALPEVGVAVGDVTDQNAKVIDSAGKPVGDGPYFGIGLDATTKGVDQLNPLNLTDGTWAAGPGQVVVDQHTAEQEKLHVGDTVRIATDHAADYKVTGIAKFGDVKSLGTATVVAFDLKTAQSVLGRGDRYDDILVAGRDGVPAADVRKAIASVVPKDVVVQTAEANDRYTFGGLKEFIKIIKIVLLVFGGVSILVGGFTILNALSITVAQRSRELALLRLVGASRKQVLGSVVVEAIALGVISSVIGIAVGVGIAKGLTTILASMGLDLPQVGMVFATHTAVTALAVGTIVTTLAGLIPAWRATRVTPVEVLRDAAAREPGIIGKGIRGIVSVLGRPAQAFGGSAGFLARRNAMRNPGRTMSTALALTIGVALVTLVTVVATGLKSSATSGLERRVSADHVIVGHDGWSPVDPSVVREASAVPGVRAVSGVAQDGGMTFGQVEFINRIEPKTLSQVFSYDWVKGDDAVPTKLDGNGAIVDDKWATEHKLKVGSTFDLKSAKGTTLSLTVAGIEKSPIIDALGLGPISIGQQAYDRAFSNKKLMVTMISAEKSAVAGLEKVMAGHPDAKLQTTHDWIKDRAKSIDTLLGIFMVLLALAVLVSLIGIVNTLLLSTFERTRELGMLRAVGMSRRQMRRMVRHESIVTAVLGALTGIGAGLGLAALVAKLWGEQGFTFVLPVTYLVAFTLVAVVAGIAAAAFPARRAAKLDPLEALAYE
jgi:putative ABC transport system permease protein